MRWKRIAHVPPIWTQAGLELREIGVRQWIILFDKSLPTGEFSVRHWLEARCSEREAKRVARLRLIGKIREWEMILRGKGGGWKTGASPEYLPFKSYHCNFGTQYTVLLLAQPQAKVYQVRLRTFVRDNLEARGALQPYWAGVACLDLHDGPSERVMKREVISLLCELLLDAQRTLWEPL